MNKPKFSIHNLYGDIIDGMLRLDSIRKFHYAREVHNKRVVHKLEFEHDEDKNWRRYWIHYQANDNMVMGYTRDDGFYLSAEENDRIMMWIEDYTGVPIDELTDGHIGYS